MNAYSFSTIALCALLAASCSSEQQASGALCVPNQSIACACINGSLGAQVCASDGLRYEDCECASRDMGVTAEDAAFDASSDASLDASADASAPRSVCEGVAPFAEAGCGKVDFLFVVDNSLSMFDKQQLLVNSFPQFISTLRAELPTTDYHLMVVDTDDIVAASGVDDCYSACGGMYECPGFDCEHGLDALGECDYALGGGVSYPISYDSQNRQCAFAAEGRRFMTNTDADLEGEFVCASILGSEGSGNEQPLGAMLAALDPTTSGGACNDGFLRADAVLVVVILSDASVDGGSEEALSLNIHAAHDRLVALKCGNEDAIVVLGLLGDQDIEGSPCELRYRDMTYFPRTLFASPRLRAFVETFGAHGVQASICEEDYTPFFVDAVDLIDTACEELVY